MSIGKVRDTAGWTADQLRERLKAAQQAGDDEAAMDYARRLMRHPDRLRENERQRAAEGA